MRVSQSAILSDPVGQFTLVSIRNFGAIVIVMLKGRALAEHPVGHNEQFGVGG